MNFYTPSLLLPAMAVGGVYLSVKAVAGLVRGVREAEPGADRIVTAAWWGFCVLLLIGFTVGVSYLFIDLVRYQLM